MNPGPPACQPAEIRKDRAYFRFTESDIAAFIDFLRAQGLSDKTIEHHRLNAYKIYRYTRGYVTAEKLLKMAARYRENYSEYHLFNLIKTMRRLFREFFKRPDLVEHIRYVRRQSIPKYIPLPTAEDLRKVAQYLQTKDTAALDVSLFLFYATTGLRRSEVLKLRISDIIWEHRAVIPAQYRRTKKTGITFFNHEAKAWLRYYLDTRESKADLLFDVTGKHFQKLWRRIRRDTGVNVSPQILRKWHAVELRKRGVPDSFVDIFQGRAPRSVLGRYYTPVGVKELKEVYDKAGLEIGVPLPDLKGDSQYTTGGPDARHDESNQGE